MHHKRKRPANRRAGCKLCKPWKINGFPTTRKGGEKFSDRRRRMATEGWGDPDAVHGISKEGVITSAPLGGRRKGYLRKHRHDRPSVRRTNWLIYQRKSERGVAEF